MTTIDHWMEDYLTANIRTDEIKRSMSRDLDLELAIRRLSMIEMALQYQYMRRGNRRGKIPSSDKFLGTLDKVKLERGDGGWWSKNFRSLRLAVNEKKYSIKAPLLQTCLEQWKHSVEDFRKSLDEQWPGSFPQHLRKACRIDPISASHFRPDVGLMIISHAAVVKERTPEELNRVISRLHRELQYKKVEFNISTYHLSNRLAYASNLDTKCRRCGIYLSACRYHIKYFGDSYIVVPKFHHSIAPEIPHRHANVPFYFHPYKGPSPLILSPPFDSTPVIITNDPLLGFRMQGIMLGRPEYRTATWATWYAEDPKVLPDLDWSPLKKKDVYYILKEHGGLNTKETLKLAEQVKCQAMDAGARNFKYASYLKSYNYSHSAPSGSRLTPIMLSSETVRQLCAETIQLPDEHVFHPTEPKKKFPSSPEMVLNPVIGAGTSTLICGSGGEWLGLAATFGVGLKRKPFAGWTIGTGRRRRNMFYQALHVCRDSTALYGANQLLAVFEGRTRDKGMRELQDLQIQLSQRKKLCTLDSSPKEPEVVPIFLRTIDIPQQSIQLQQLEQVVCQFAQSLATLLPCKRLIILENLFPMGEEYHNGILRSVLKTLTTDGWAVVVVESESFMPEHRKPLVEQIGFDNVIATTSNKVGGKLFIDAAIEKACVKLPPKEEQFTLELNKKSTPPTLVRLKKRARPPCRLNSAEIKELKELIRKCHHRPTASCNDLMENLERPQKEKIQKVFDEWKKKAPSPNSRLTEKDLLSLLEIKLGESKVSLYWIKRLRKELGFCDEWTKHALDQENNAISYIRQHYQFGIRDKKELAELLQQNMKIKMSPYKVGILMDRANLL